ncbi:ABC transporter substrate-binding protein [Kineosporia babensis]|uniref:ABC transporter substrate-binding protein n=1 Tax=Kineosporia babensis TaxID=499548 RepID=A0A9X1NN19_9ACTN|nr:ABC transporter substrate-binding protein [Kineosporia babensis]MCD5316534.1 ABC transporter substrate-binding protein [Kineosporia babensis]
MKSRTRKLAPRTAILAIAALATAGLAACGGDSDNGDAPAQSDSGGKITVWVDPPRVPAAQAFEKAHPEIEIEINQIDGTVGGKTLQQQFAQFNQAGKGWPDAIFFPSNDDIAWAAGAQINWAADLTELLPEVIEGYDPAVLAPCDIDERIRCLRNDAAPDVFWYNAKFFAENNYDLPTTWEEYASLAVTIAQEHPGKISGFTGDAYAPDRYLWASNCPTNARQSETEVKIALDDPNCLRAKDLLAEMYDGKALSTLGIFDADAAEVGKELVMSPGAAWWGDYLFNQTWKIPAGEMTAIEPLKWAGGSAPATGNEGGGLWGVSNHITGKQLENTLTFAEFVATDPAWQVELSTGLPAYGGAQDAWVEKQSAGEYFADNETTFAAMKAAIGYVQPDHAYMLYNTGSVWTETVVPALVDGKSMDDAWSAFSTELVNQAKAMGYTVQ